MADDPGVMIAALSLVVTVVGGGFVWARNWGKIEAAAEVAREAKAEASAIRQELADHKERSARDFVTAEMIGQIRREVSDGFTALGNRIDQILMQRQRNSDGN